MDRLILSIVIIVLFLTGCSVRTEGPVSDTVYPFESEPVTSATTQSIDNSMPAEPRNKFAENNSPCEYLNYKEVSCNAGSCVINVKCPSTWNEYYVTASDEYIPQHTGVQLFDSELPEQLEVLDGNIFVAAAASGFASEHVNERYDFGDYESFTTTNGYKLKIYYGKNKLPEYATFEDYPSMCIFFSLENEEELPEIVNIVNSIELQESAW